MVGILEVVQVAEEVVIHMVNFDILSGELNGPDEFELPLLVEVPDEVVLGSQLELIVHLLAVTDEPSL